MIIFLVINNRWQDLIIKESDVVEANCNTLKNSICQFCFLCQTVRIQFGLDSPTVA